MVGNGSSAVPGFAARSSLAFISSGAKTPNPQGVLESEGFRLLLDQLEASFDVVLIDGTPLTMVSDSIPVVRCVDGVLLVSRSSTDARSALHASDILERIPGANVIGLVVNDVPETEAAAYGKGYGYGYYGTAIRVGTATATERNPRLKQIGPRDLRRKIQLADAIGTGRPWSRRWPAHTRRLPRSHAVPAECARPDTAVPRGYSTGRRDAARAQPVNRQRRDPSSPRMNSARRRLTLYARSADRRNLSVTMEYEWTLPLGRRCASTSWL